MTFRQIDTDALAGRDHQPVAALDANVAQLAGRYGLEFTAEVDDLGSVLVAAFEADGVRFLLRHWPDNPDGGTLAHSPTVGDPASQARTLVDALPEVPVDRWWDGETWHDGAVPSAA